ncbi:unnamed protein product [Rhizophagus irregularis]|nr:unnamed protein product [Rhizophagus irregularis]
MLLLESSVEVAHKIYMDNMKLKGKESEILRRKLNEERTRSRETNRKGNEEKNQERMISQKNEQIRKISQELEKTSSELKKVKAGRNKENDHQNNSKKGRSSSIKKKREEILEIPVLPEITNDDPKFKDAREIFFYDIPKYWSEEDVRTNLMKIGQVMRIQIRGQYKYKTVKAKISLNENFERTFKEGHFGICINKTFIRWYDAKLGLKDRQERDRWQTVRDLTNEEMDSLKKGTSYEFIKQLQKNSKTAFLKIIKITKNWKVIGYFKNQKSMEEAVEDSCTVGDINRVWLVRNRKTIYKEGKKLNKEKKVIKKSGKGESALSYEMNVGPESKETSNEPLTPMTPPDRIYRELGNFASRKESLTHPSKEEAFHQKKELPNDDSDSEESVISYREAQARERSRKKTPEEQAVVDMIKKWRLNEENSPDQTDTVQKKSEQLPLKKELKKDNVAPEEVVKIINEHREVEKIKYEQYDFYSASHEEAKDKLDELKAIFGRLENEMEWEKINEQAISEITESLSPKELKWMEQGDDTINFTIGRQVISLAEQHDIVRLYTTLNDGFEQRLKDENRYQDKKEIGDKRPIFDSPKKSETSGSSESESEAEDIKPYVLESKKGENSTKATKISADKKKKKKKKNRNYRK